jgi:hypothetical protein
MFSGCSKDDLPNGGNPRITFVRVTRPAAADSLLTTAGQGDMIAIMGENLGDARAIWFNDLPAVLTPTFITSTSIITRVPAEIPTDITNKMRIVFGNGQELVHDFTVDISKPEITGMLSEYGNPGDVATITGNYFYQPLKVTFTGGVEGKVVSVKDDLIEVTVPEGAQPGPITVSTNFGKTESAFWFRDNRNLIASFDGTTNGLWHGPAFIVASDEEIPAINNKFIRVNKELGAWGWFEMYVGPTDSDVALETKNIPADAFTNPQQYNLKFEINTLKPLTGAEIKMYMGPGDMGSDRNTTFYNWKPNIDTKGEWQTVSIPWEEFWTANKKFAYSPAGYGVSFHFSGPLAVSANFGLDNMRVVPNTNQ